MKKWKLKHSLNSYFPNTQDSNVFQHYFVCFVHDQLKSISSFYDILSFILSSDHIPDSMGVMNILQCDCNMVKLDRKIQIKKTLTFRKSAKEHLNRKCCQGKWTDNIANQLRIFSPAQGNNLRKQQWLQDVTCITADTVVIYYGWW